MKYRTRLLGRPFNSIPSIITLTDDLLTFLLVGLGIFGEGDLAEGANFGKILKSKIQEKK